jgi:acyl-CoA synthetase (AMP-forming)/AMP-acid ligase II
MRGYTYLVDGETTEAGLTYEELDRRARAIAAALQLAGASGERVLLLYPSGLDFITAFFGCLYAGAVAVPAYPPAAHKSAQRLQVIAADAQAKLALTTSAIKIQTKTSWPELADIQTILTDALPPGSEERWQNPAATGESCALLQYTSGSTAIPRGIMVTHNNLLDNLELIHTCVDTSPDTPGVCWLPMFHDMGLLTGILEPIYVGAHTTLMSPIAFLQRPFRWLQALSHRRAVITGAPNFALDLCVRRITTDQRAMLDLSRLDVLFVSAEPVRIETLNRFGEYFASSGFRRTAFYPCYGLAESTLVVAGGARAAPPVVKRFMVDGLARNRVRIAHRNDEPARSLVGCGHTRGNHHLLIVDPVTYRRCLPNQVGEIWVSGASVAQGYWNRQLETKQTFRAYLADTGEGPFLRTGDLGFCKANELFITGRMKDAIIIHGTNYSPQEIEATVEESDPALRPGCGAAIAVEVAGEERLVTIQEVERGYHKEDAEEVIGAIRQRVAEEHGLQIYAIVLVKPGSIPKTTSGKIQRFACRERFLAGTLEIVAFRQLSSVPLGVRQSACEDNIRQ